jgi:hypothetical protein
MEGLGRGAHQLAAGAVQVNWIHFHYLVLMDGIGQLHPFAQFLLAAFPATMVWVAYRWLGRKLP